jgi:DNA-binding NarL/FixJ family response regulator
MAIRVLLVDDHAMVLQGLRIFLGTDPHIKIVGQARDGNEAIRLAEDLKPDVVLMDLLMPGMGGIEAIESIRRSTPETEVIALTSMLEDGSVIGAIKAGAIGYLLKDTEGDELCRAIHAAAQGKVQLSPEAAARLVREVARPTQPEQLTERELEVLRLLCAGGTNKEIAHRLSLGESTVKTHVSNILAKLGMQSRTQAAVYAAQNGLAELQTA